MPAKKTVKKVVNKVVAPKKTATKSVAKKSTATKRAVAKKKTVSKKAITRVQDKACACTTMCKPEESFWVNKGPVVSSVAELKQALSDMSATQYSYHTKRNGNDFAQWLRHCLDDEAHAVALEKAKTKAAAVSALSSGCCEKR